MPEINPNIIYPNGWLVLYKDVELDNTYNHCFSFTSESDRESIFDAGGSNHYPLVATFDNMLYQHVKNENKIRIQIDKMNVANNSIYSVNYMRFKNNSYENKWFYAFVTEITYINDKVCELSYELDVMTTFYFDYHLGSCYIEREHSKTDDWKDCLVPENLETGDYVFDANQPLMPIMFNTILEAGSTNPFSRNLSLVLVANDTFIPEGTPVDPNFPMNLRYRSGLPSSNFLFEMTYARYIVGEVDPDHPDEDDPQHIKPPYWKMATDAQLEQFYTDYIDKYVSAGKTDALIGLFIIPSMLYSSLSTGENFEYFIRCDLNKEFFDGQEYYKPFNKKMFTYPYKMCYVRDLAGNSGVYKYEHTIHLTPAEESHEERRDAIRLMYTGNISGTPSSVVVPAYYKGTFGYDNGKDYSPVRNFDEAMTFSSYPQLSLVTDTYKQWLAENGTITILGALKGVVGGLGGVMYGAASGMPSAMFAGAGSVGLSVASAMAKFKQAEIQPNQSLTAGTASPLLLYNMTDFLMGVKEITPSMARSIDDYFTMFGYAVHKCEVPQRRCRLYWTYIKTLGCVLTGSIPNSFLKKISSIFDMGTTFWHTSQKGRIGDYTQSESRINSPIGEG